MSSDGRRKPIPEGCTGSINCEVEGHLVSRHFKNGRSVFGHIVLTPGQRKTIRERRTRKVSALAFPKADEATKLSSEQLHRFPGPVSETIAFEPDAEQRAQMIAEAERRWPALARPEGVPVVGATLPEGLCGELSRNTEHCVFLTNHEGDHSWQ